MLKAELNFNMEFDHKAALCKGLLFFHEHAILLKEISWIEGTSQLTKVHLSQMDNSMLPAYMVSSSARQKSHYLPDIALAKSTKVLKLNSYNINIIEE